MRGQQPRAGPRRHPTRHEAQTPEGNLTPIARQKLQHWFSDIPMDGPLKPSDLSRYFTIQTFTVIVRDLLETRGDAAPATPQA